MTGPQVMRRQWTVEEVSQLQKLVRQDTPRSGHCQKAWSLLERSLRKSLSRGDFAKACAHTSRAWGEELEERSPELTRKPRTP
jgi:hypothetical protein